MKLDDASLKVFSNSNTRCRPIACAVSHMRVCKTSSYDQQDVKVVDTKDP